MLTGGCSSSCCATVVSVSEAVPELRAMATSRPAAALLQYKRGAESDAKHYWVCCSEAAGAESKHKLKGTTDTDKEAVEHMFVSVQLSTAHKDGCCSISDCALCYLESALPGTGFSSGNAVSSFLFLLPSSSCSPSGRPGLASLRTLRAI